MKFSKKSEYGLRALIELTKNYGHPITRQQIGERQNVPVVFLEQILLSLKHAGLLGSPRRLCPHQAALQGHARAGHPHPRWTAGSDRVREQDRVSEMPGLPVHEEGLLPVTTRHGRGEKRDRRYLG
jgi:hypothetical protein